MGEKDAPNPAPPSEDERGGASRLRWLRPGRFLRDLNILAILILIAAAAALLLLPGSDDGLLGLPELTVGQDAPRTVKSPRAFAIADIETTERLRHEAVAHVLPVYDLKTAQGGEAKERIETAFANDAALRALDGGTQKAEEAHELIRFRAQEFLRTLQVFIEEDALLPLFKAGDPDELRDATIMIAQNLYERRIVDDRALLRLQAPEGIQLRIIEPDETADKEETLKVKRFEELTSIDQARARVDELASELLKRLPIDQRRAVSLIVKRLIHPNVVANRNETEHRIEEARDSVKTFVIPIKPGETVLRAGERITESHLFILRGIERELKAQSRAQAAAGSSLLIVLLIVITYRFMVRSFRAFEPSHRDLAFLASAYLIMLLLIWLGYKGVMWASESFPYLPASAYRLVLPIAGFTLLVRFVVGAEYAVAFAALAAFTSGWMMGANIGFAAYALSGSLAAASVHSTERPRTALFVAGVRTALAQVFVVCAIALLDSRFTIEDTGGEVAAAVASGLLSALIAALLLPAVEAIFGYTTDLKLTDLANLNHPLLRELLVEAPGTYHHAIMVGTLAESGAGAIGANKLLARVGAYYHDIGKIKNARAYEENVQRSFASIAPAEEAKEIRMHVAHGLELAAKHRLGPPVLEIIAQHHGLSLVRASYRRALDLTPGAAKTDFAYAGPKPLSKEAALVMLADVVETATTRDLAAEVTLDVAVIEAAVRRVIGEVLAEGQLDRSELTLLDLERVIREFVIVLEDRWIRRGRLTLSQLPRVPSAQMVRPPLGGPLN